jgi:hypothetical protein
MKRSRRGLRPEKIRVHNSTRKGEHSLSAKPYTETFSSQPDRYRALRELRGAVMAIKPHDRDEFRDLLTACLRHDYAALDARALAEEMGLMSNAAERWVEERNTPHPSLWAEVTRHLIDQLGAATRAEKARLESEESADE